MVTTKRNRNRPPKIRRRTTRLLDSAPKPSPHRSVLDSDHSTTNTHIAFLVAGVHTTGRRGEMRTSSGVALRLLIPGLSVISTGSSDGVLMSKP
ncbi:hypothetical protein AKJ16_DCAP14101 [Drosera capensis]